MARMKGMHGWKVSAILSQLSVFGTATRSGAPTAEGVRQHIPGQSGPHQAAQACCSLGHHSPRQVPG